MTEAPRQILFITFEGIGPRIGGSAIRVLGLARALAMIGHSVMVAAPRVAEDYPKQAFTIRNFDLQRPREVLVPLLKDAAVAVLPAHGLARLPFVQSATIPLVFDLYDPVVFELMETATREFEAHLHLLNRVLRRGDFFLCASERQRDFWLGALASNRRIVPSPALDPEQRDLIDVVPFGIDPASVPAAAASRRSLVEKIPALAGAQKIIIWPGGIWDWNDPETLLSAMRILAGESPGIHLLLFGGKHPGADHVMTAGARAVCAAALHNVRFIEDYVAYEKRGEYLAACDAVVSTHRKNLESRFAYRARFLDCIWAGLPIVCTEGDVFAEAVVRHGFGLVVPAKDPAALAHAIAQIFTDAEFAASCRTHIAEQRPLFSWNEAVRPLARFCEQPRVTHVKSSVAHLVALTASALTVFATHGARETLRRVKQHLRGR